MSKLYMIRTSFTSFAAWFSWTPLGLHRGRARAAAVRRPTSHSGTCSAASMEIDAFAAPRAVVGGCGDNGGHFGHFHALVGTCTRHRRRRRRRRSPPAAFCRRGSLHGRGSGGQRGGERTISCRRRQPRRVFALVGARRTLALRRSGSADHTEHVRGVWHVVLLVAGC